MDDINKTFEEKWKQRPWYIKEISDKEHALIWFKKGIEETKIQKYEVNESFVKRILFSMWEVVEKGQFDARSFVGDTALDLRGILFEDDEKTFWTEYDKWKTERQ